MPLIEEGAPMTAVPRSARMSRALLWLRLYTYATAIAIWCTWNWWEGGWGGRHYFWQEWIWLSLATVAVAHAATAQIWRRTRGRNRWFALHLVLAVLTAAVLSSGLAGLSQRAAALDGCFAVGDLGSTSPGGSVGGTVVRAELPCGFDSGV